MKIDGAIFDVDGTLLDSMFIWDTIGEDYLISRGITPKENLNQTFKSMSLLQAAEYYQSEYGLKESTADIMDGVNFMIEHLYANKVNAKKGVKEFLEYLQKSKVKMCIATATDRYLVEAALKRNGLSDFFSEIFTCTVVGEGKDKPTIYQKALEYLHTDKKYTCIFEDALYAIKTAKYAGFKVAAVQDDSEFENKNKIVEMSDIYLKTFAEWRNYFD